MILMATPRAEQGAVDHDDRDDHRIAPVMQKQGDRGTYQQDQHKWIAELAAQQGEGGIAAVYRDDAAALARAPLRRLRGGEPGGTTLQNCEELLRRA